MLRPLALGRVDPFAVGPGHGSGKKFGAGVTATN